jgi:hypothetical protein
MHFLSPRPAIFGVSPALFWYEVDAPGFEFRLFGPEQPLASSLLGVLWKAIPTRGGRTMKRLLKALLDFRNSRDSWAWRAHPWLLAALLLVPVGAVLPWAGARVNPRRRSTHASR